MLNNLLECVCSDKLKRGGTLSVPIAPLSGAEYAGSIHPSGGCRLGSIPSAPTKKDWVLRRRRTRLWRGFPAPRMFQPQLQRRRTLVRRSLGEGDHHYAVAFAKATIGQRRQIIKNTLPHFGGACFVI